MRKVENCPLCGGEGTHMDFKPYHEHEWIASLSVDRCQTCLTVYQNPRLSDAELKEYYSSGAYRKEHPSISKLDEERAERTLAAIERFDVFPESCLDIGCGRGSLLKQLDCARVLGLEYDPEIPEIDDVVYSKDDVVDTFDLITCIHVMEHMPEPAKEFEWMIGKLNYGGTLMLEMPTYVSPDLSHLFIPTKKGVQMMIGDLIHAYLEYENHCQVFIGDKYTRKECFRYASQ